MTRQEKEEIVKILSEKLNESGVFYLADISELDASLSCASVFSLSR